MEAFSFGNGKYRLPIRKIEYPRIDKVFASEEETLAAEIEFKCKHEKFFDDFK